MKPTKRGPFRAPGWAIFLTLILAAEVHAGAPNVMTYQGRLKESGLPVTGVRSVDIQLCPTPSGGGCIDTGSQNVQVVNGLFRTTFTIPGSVALEDGPWYLEVQVGAQAFTPREMLNSSPYALYASSAATLIPNPGFTSVEIASPLTIQAQNASGYSLVLSSGLSAPVGTVSAQYFVGNGAGISGIVATSVQASGVQNGTLNSGVLVRAGSVVNGPLSSGVLPSTVAYTSTANNFTDRQTISAASGAVVTYGLSAGSMTIVGGLTASSATFTASGNAQYSIETSSGIIVQTGGVKAAFFVGDGSALTNVAAGAVAAANVLPGTFGPAVLLPAGNLTSGPIAVGMLPSTVAYTSTANNFTDRQTISAASGAGVTYGLSAGSMTIVGGLTASSATFTASGNTQYSLQTSSGINVVAGAVTAPYFVGDGSHLTNLSGIDSSKVAKAGDTMTGQLTLQGSTLTVTGNAFSVGVATFVVSSGKIGIGTASPTSLLHVSGVTANTGVLIDNSVGNGNPYLIVKALPGAGNASIVADRADTGGNAGFFLRDAGAPQWAFKVPDFTSGDATRLDILDATNTPRLTLLQSGRVGIGTVTPGSTLHVVGSMTLTGPLTASSGTFTAIGNTQYSLQTSSGVNILAGAVTAPYFIGDGSHLTNLSGIDSSKVAKAGDTMTGQLTLQGSTLTVTGDAFSVGVATLVVSSGKIGIGTASPTSALDVVGRVNVGGGSSGVTFNGNAASAPMLFTWNQGTGPAFNAQNSLYVLNTGNVGIGTASPGNTLHVVGSGTVTGTLTVMEGMTVSSASFTGTGDSLYSIRASSGIRILNGGVTAPFFAGNGAALTDVIAAPPANMATIDTIQTISAVKTFAASPSVTAAAGLDVTYGLTAGSMTVTNAVGIGAVGLSGGLMVLRSTTTTPTSPVLAVQNNAGTEIIRVQQNSRVGIGTMTPGNTLHVNGIFQAQSAILDVAGDALTLSGNGASLKFSGTGPSTIQTAASQNLNLFPGGKVGVNTSAPATLLDVNGDAQFGSGATKSTFSVTGGLTFPVGYGPTAAADAATKGYVDGQVTGGSGWTKNGNVVFLTSSGDNVIVQTTMTVQGNGFSVGATTFVVVGGKVGVGTSSPSTNLEVAGGLRATGLGVGTAANGGGISFGPSSLFSGSDQVNFNLNSKALHMRVGASEGSGIILLRQSGDVGIATSAPSYRLHVSSGSGETGTILAVSTGTSDMFRVLGTGEVIAYRFTGDGAGLTNVSGTDGTKVLKTGDTMTGQLTISGSSLTVGGGLLALGTYESSIPSGAGSRFMWVPSSAAIRAGIVTGSEWDPANIGPYSTAFGYNAKASTYAAVGGGLNNEAVALTATVGGGNLNRATNISAVVAGGDNNLASGQYSAIPGGNSNTASGSYATAAGGNLNTAAGDYSFAAGRRAKANAIGSFVWADSQNVDFNGDLADTFYVRAQGGAVFTNGVSSSMFISNVGDIGIGAGVPSSKLNIFDGDIRISTSVGNRGIYFQDGSYQQTAAGSSQWQTNATHIYNSNTGFVGIGTSLPNTMLHVVGSATVTGTVLSQYGIFGASLAVNGGTFAVGGSSFVVTNGKIGVGTSNPSERLSLDGGNFVSNRPVGSSVFSMGTVAGTVARIFAGDSSGDGLSTNFNQIKMTADSANTEELLRLHTGADASSDIGTAALYFGQFNLPDMAAVKAVNEGGAPLNRRAGLSFWTEPPGTGVPLVERMRITGLGNVGIGTTNPNATLHVVGSATITGYLSASSITLTGDLTTSSLTVTGRLMASSATFSGLSVSTLAVTNTFVVADSTFVVSEGRIGIGTASPKTSFHIAGGPVLSTGSYLGFGEPPVNGEGTRFMWVPSLAAIRAGGVASTQWDTLGAYSVAFGQNNNVTGANSVIAGGQDNFASGANAAIAGGRNHTATGINSMIPGGANNSALGNYSLAAGKRAKANGQGTFVWADSQDVDFPGDASDTFYVRAQGGMVFSSGISTYVFVSNTGAVGIGTASPSTTLHVIGSATVTGQMRVNSSSFSVGGTDFIVSGASITAGGSNFVISGSSVGIGVLEPATALHVVGSATVSAALVAQRVAIATTNASFDLSFGPGARTIGIETLMMVGAGSDLAVSAGNAPTIGGDGGNITMQAGTHGSGGGTNGAEVILKPGTRTAGAPAVRIDGGTSGGAHLKATQSAVPTWSGPSNCGAGGAMGAQVLAGSTDMAGLVSITSGSGGSPTTCDTTITFAKVYTNLTGDGIKVMLTPTNKEAALRQAYVTPAAGPSSANFTIVFSSNPALNTVHTFSYMVIE